MTIREKWEQEEQKRLSPYAVKSVDSKGREKPQEDCEIRTSFQRDRDRIIHCKSFRRLKHKTQVFLSPEGDHYRTRLTHTLEVSQVARTIARGLFLNEDLAEAIALGHDLGHTPFGHTGERALDRLMPGGFRHNEQSLRVVDKLENGSGLNLTWEVRNGILTHCGKELPQTLEGMCVRYADRIAYINHDIDDAIRAGVIAEHMLPSSCLETLGKTHSARINTMIKDIIYNSMDRDYVRMTPQIQESTDLLRDFMFKEVYHNPWKEREEAKCEKAIETMFGRYCEHPTEMPMEYVQLIYTDGIERAVCDFIACMTDRYAMKTYRDLVMPAAFTSIP